MDNELLKYVYSNGFHFHFKYDPNFPKLLHITAKHQTTEEDAIKTFFGGQTIWNEKHKRFQTILLNKTLYWYWFRNKPKKVMVITCFTSNI